MQEPCYYGFPVFGEPAVKVAQDGGGAETTADSRTFAPDEDNRARVIEFMRRRSRARSAASGSSRPASTRCRPTATSCSTGSPATSDVLLAVGAGHAFKFATQIGAHPHRARAHGATAHDISLFRADREALSDFARRAPGTSD